MTINNVDRDIVVDNLITTDTTEQSFRNAIRDVAFQADANDLELKTVRTLAITGPVQAAMINFDLSATSKAISIETTLMDDIISNDQIANNAVENLQVADNAITNRNIDNNAVTSSKIAVDQINGTHISFTASRRLVISDPAGGMLFDMYGFKTVT